MVGFLRTSLRRAISVSIYRTKSKSKSNPEIISSSYLSKTLNSSSCTRYHQVAFEPTTRRLITTAAGPGGLPAETAGKPSVSIWRRKKEIGKEGLIVAKELKRLQSNPVRLQRYIQFNVSRLLKSDLVSVLAEFQRQDQVFLSMKLYDVVRREIWYRPDMFFYRDMLMMLARNKKVEEVKKVWSDLKGEGVLFDQHTFGDLIRAFLDYGLPNEAMEIYDEMRESPDRPLSLPYRVILKGLIPYPELREKVKDDFLELFPGKFVYDPPEDLFEDQEWRTDSEEY